MITAVPALAGQAFSNIPEDVINQPLLVPEVQSGRSVHVNPQLRQVAAARWPGLLTAGALVGGKLLGLSTAISWNLLGIASANQSMAWAARHPGSSRPSGTWCPPRAPLVQRARLALHRRSKKTLDGEFGV